VITKGELKVEGEALRVVSVFIGWSRFIGVSFFKKPQTEQIFLKKERDAAERQGEVKTQRADLESAPTNL